MNVIKFHLVASCVAEIARHTIWKSEQFLGEVEESKLKSKSVKQQKKQIVLSVD